MAFVCFFVDLKGSEVTGDGNGFCWHLVAPGGRDMAAKGKRGGDTSKISTD